jgi:hypothetical protein
MLIKECTPIKAAIAMNKYRLWSECVEVLKRFYETSLLFNI